MTNKTTKDIIYLILDAVSTIILIISIVAGVIFSIDYGYNMKEEDSTRETKRSLNHIDTPEEMPEVSYNTYYLLTWHSTNGTFISEGSLKYDLPDSWDFGNLPEDTLFISTYDNDILTLQQFKDTYSSTLISLARANNQTIVPYIATSLNGVAENFNILLSLNTFLYNTDYRYLNIYNNVGTYSLTTYWSLMNADETLDAEYIIKWGQPSLLLETETITHTYQTSIVLQAFIQPISIKFENEKAIDIAYDTGYENGLKSGLGFFSILESATNSIHNVMSIEIIPGLTLATMLGVFVGLPLFFFFLKMISAK